MESFRYGGPPPCSIGLLAANFSSEISLFKIPFLDVIDCIMEFDLDKFQNFDTSLCSRGSDNVIGSYPVSVQVKFDLMRWFWVVNIYCGRNDEPCSCFGCVGAFGH